MYFKSLIRKIIKNTQDKNINNYFKQHKLDFTTFFESHNINKCSDGFCSDNNDPYFIFKINNPIKLFKIVLGIESEITNDIKIYYSSSDYPYFSESNIICFGPVNGTVISKNFSFSEKIKWLRIDPIDVISTFNILDFNIIPINQNEINQDNNILLENYFYSIPYSEELEDLKRIFNQKQIISEKTVVFITHEISKTGAPLLCRKISKRLLDLGYFTIIISLSTINDIQEFKNSSTVLMSPQNKTEMIKLFELLRINNIDKAITSTVLTGEYTRYLNENGFKVVSLIHEMEASCLILQAESKVKTIAEYANYAVFPAECVSQDFLYICQNPKCEIIVRPQGYYKDVNNIKKDDNHKKELIKKLGLSDETLFFCSAGSINFGKGADLLALVAKELIKKEDELKCNFHFLWLGSVDSANKNYNIWLKNQIKKSGLADRFHFIEYIDNEKEYMDYLCSCEGFLLVSREDSMPSVILEAMSINLPVVAFIKSGGAESVLSDSRGYLADYMDINDFCDKAIDLCTNKNNTDAVTNKANTYLSQSLNFNDYVEFLINLF